MTTSNKDDERRGEGWKYQPNNLDYFILGFAACVTLTVISVWLFS